MPKHNAPTCAQARLATFLAEVAAELPCDDSPAAYFQRVAEQFGADADALQRAAAGEPRAVPASLARKLARHIVE